MFSGIRSMIFGYSEPSDADNSTITNQDSSLQVASVRNDVSSNSLEQTLNAATTILTEQLLPQSPSIEQLQSSSRQLLPSLTEQHEEDELRKVHNVKVESTLDEDDDCFIADSWELLDLVEGTVATENPATVTQQKPASPGPKDEAVKATGILKVAKKKFDKKNGQSSNDSIGQKPKSKVSFETPNLVKEKQEIELTQGCDSIGSKTKVKADQPGEIVKRSSSANGEPKEYETKIVENKTTDDCKKVYDLNENMGSGQVKNSDGIPENEKEVPKLNYAAALSMNIDTMDDYDDSDEYSLRRQIMRTRRQFELLTQAKPIKRNRPVSSSSWSSSDEAEAPAEEPKVEVDDTESVVSSGFSDCDYGYEGINDFVMRPKKAKNIKSSASQSKEMTKSMSLRNKLDSRPMEASMYLKGNFKCQDLKAKSSKSSLKPKKKKLLSNQPESSDCVESQDSPIASTSSTESPSSGLKGNFLAPPDSNGSTKSATPSSTDSSDVAEMDESWYVTPPPCFTGSKKVTASGQKAKEAARENELIERPTVFIAGNIAEERAKPAKKNTEKSSPSGKTESSKVIVLKKVQKPKVEQKIPEVQVAPMEVLDTTTEANTSIQTQVCNELNSEAGPTVEEESRRQATRVQPIEPERRPGWQLRRQRSKRRPLASNNSVGNGSTCGVGISALKVRELPTSAKISAKQEKVNCAERQSPTLMDRIGSSIAANLSNLTSGFASLESGVGQKVGGLGSCRIGSEKQNEEAARALKCSADCDSPAVRRRLSKSYLGRQNECADKSSVNGRHTGRRLKMQSRQNGISVNRKVHTNFH